MAEAVKRCAAVEPIVHSSLHPNETLRTDADRYG